MAYNLLLESGDALLLESGEVLLLAGPILQVPRRARTNIEVKLYDRNLSSPILITDLTYRIQNPKFSTKLHGGFNLCSFALKADLPQAWHWLINRMFFRVVIADKSRMLWEGRIQDIGISPGMVDITAYGYYASLNDEPYRTAYDDDADVVIKAMLTAAAPQINADQSNIAATGGPPIISSAGPAYLDKKVRVLVEKFMKFGGTGTQWYFAIWDNRIPYLFQRNISSVDWTVKLGDLARFKLRHSGSDLWNESYAVYEDGGLARTPDAEDTTSQAKYGDGTNDFIRSHAIQDLGTVDAEAAESARDTWLAEHKDIWPTLEDIALGDRVYDTNGVAYPSSWVRAGDVLRVLDLVPATSSLDEVSRDALRTFYILETNYNAGLQQNQIVVDTESNSLDAIIARIPK